MLRIITDTASDISIEKAKQLNVELMPLTVRFGDDSYKTLYELTIKEFYEKLAASDELPKTAQVNPFEFEEKFNEVIDAGDEAIVILLSSALSGTYQSAVIAVDNLETDKITVIDSLTVAGAEGLLVHMAAKLRDEGKSRQEVVDAINSYIPRTRLFLVLDTLEYLKKGGRISPTIAFVGEAIKLRPIVTIADGKVTIADKCKGDKAAIKRLLAKLDDIPKDDISPIIVGNADCAEKSESLIAALSDKGYDIYDNFDIGCVVGTYAGPNALGYYYISK